MLEPLIYGTYVQILKDELLPAMGCTEPIAVAYAAAIARQALGQTPDRVTIEVSRNIIKNVKSVVVPHTGGMRGLEAACAAGIVAGRADKELEVISDVTPQQISQIQQYVNDTPMTVDFAKSDLIFDIAITVCHGEESAFARIVDYHTNVVCIRKGDQVLLSKEITGKTESSMADKSLLTIENIFHFANEVRIEDVKEVLDRQISYNMAIAEEGLRGDYGANIGKVLLKTYGDSDVKVRAKAYAAAGSDARMNGCELPVVINSGSGNQGITCSVPLIVYAREMELPESCLYRALVFSNLLTVYQKEYIGKLSAFCGAVSASCAVGAAITYIGGGDLEAIRRTIENTLANIPGIICDGAKISCAAKIAAGLDAAFLAHHLSMNGKAYAPYTGILRKSAEETISCVGMIGKEGMKETDREILQIMLQH